MSFYSKYKSRIKTWRRKFVLLLIFPPLLLVIFIFRILPIASVRSFAGLAGKYFYKYAKKSREWALANIERVYKDKLSENDRVEIAKASFTEVIKGFFDYMAFSHVKNPDKFFSLIEVEGEEHLHAAYTRGKGVICLMPHMSSWEFAAITPPMLGYVTSAASQSMKMGLLEKLMVTFRGSRGMKNITRQGSYQALVDVLNRGECLILMTDQDTRVKGIFVDFLGHPAYTPLGASRLLSDTQAALVPMAMYRKKDGNYRFSILPEIPTNKTNNPEADLRSNTLNQNNFYTEMILKHPTQWVWMHRRWKTTPESLAATLAAREAATRNK